MRVLRWVYERIRGKNPGARETPVGIVPTPDAIGAAELGIAANVAESLLSIDRDDWLHEVDDQGTFLEQFGDRLPERVASEHRALRDRLTRS